MHLPEDTVPYNVHTGKRVYLNAGQPRPSLLCVGFSFDDEPTVNSQDELAVATSSICPVAHHPLFSTTPRWERHPSSFELIFTHIFGWTRGVGERDGRRLYRFR
jgi:hypothetical protein